jgi:hypothetical protein
MLLRGASFLCLLLLLVRIRAENAQVVLLSPSQGEAIPGSTLTIQWQVNNYKLEEDGDKAVVLLVNGAVVHVSVRVAAPEKRQ